MSVTSEKNMSLKVFFKTKQIQWPGDKNRKNKRDTEKQKLLLL